MKLDFGKPLMPFSRYTLSMPLINGKTEVLEIVLDAHRSDVVVAIEPHDILHCLAAQSDRAEIIRKSRDVKPFLRHRKYKHKNRYKILENGNYRVDKQAFARVLA